jgi:hypothetical protein
MATDLLTFTDPEGHPVYISAGSVISVSRPIGMERTVRATIMTGGGMHGVQETVDQVMSKLLK